MAYLSNVLICTEEKYMENSWRAMVANSDLGVNKNEHVQSIVDT